MNTQQLCFRIMLLIFSVALLFVNNVMLMEQLKSYSSEMKEDVWVMDDGKNG